MELNSKQKCLALSAPSIDCCYLPHFAQWGQTVNHSVLRYQLHQLTAATYPILHHGSTSKQQCLALSAILIDCCYLPHFTQWGQTVNNSVLRHQFQPLLYIIIIYIYISALSIDCYYLPHFTHWGQTVNNSVLRYQFHQLTAATSPILHSGVKQ